MYWCHNIFIVGFTICHCHHLFVIRVSYIWQAQVCHWCSTLQAWLSRLQAWCVCAVSMQCVGCISWLSGDIQSLMTCLFFGCILPKNAAAATAGCCFCYVLPHVHPHYSDQRASHCMPFSPLLLEAQGQAFETNYSLTLSMKILIL